MSIVSTLRISVKALAASFVAIPLLAGAAFAVTITSSTTPVKSVDITCTGSCDFWDLGLDPDGFNDSAGSWLSAAYGGIDGNNNNADRVDFVNNVIGTTSFTTQSASSDSGVGAGSIDDPDGMEFFSWTGSGQYYLAWSAFDPRYILIRNNSENNTFTWDGKGLSGLDAFGTVAPVPLPPAVLMLLAGLGGLIVVGKRKSHPA